MAISVKNYLPAAKYGGVLDNIPISDIGSLTDANGNELLTGDTVASAVNNFEVANAATGTNPLLSVIGDDTNVGMDVTSKGTGGITLWSGTKGRELLILPDVASAVNEFTVSSAATATNPSIAASGGDTNIGINLTPKGTGVPYSTVISGLGVPTKLTVTTDTTAGALTYTAAMLKGGLILRDPNGAGRSDVTPTAALLVAAFPGCPVGTSFEFEIVNTADASETITVTAGTNCTIVGTATIAQNNCKRFLVRLDNVTASSEAYTLYSLGTSTT